MPATFDKKLVEVGRLALDPGDYTAFHVLSTVYTTAGVLQEGEAKVVHVAGVSTLSTAAGRMTNCLVRELCMISKLWLGGRRDVAKGEEG